VRSPSFPQSSGNWGEKVFKEGELDVTKNGGMFFSHVRVYCEKEAECFEGKASSWRGKYTLNSLQWPTLVSLLHLTSGPS